MCRKNYRSAIGCLCAQSKFSIDLPDRILPLIFRGRGSRIISEIHIYQIARHLDHFEEEVQVGISVGGLIEMSEPVCVCWYSKPLFRNHERSPDYGQALFRRSATAAVYLLNVALCFNEDAPVSVSSESVPTGASPWPKGCKLAAVLAEPDCTQEIFVSIFCVLLPCKRRYPFDLVGTDLHIRERLGDLRGQFCGKMIHIRLYLPLAASVCSSTAVNTSIHIRTISPHARQGGLVEAFQSLRSLRKQGQAYSRQDCSAVLG